MPRVLPPVRSPLSLGGLLRGWGSARNQRTASKSAAELREALTRRGYSGQLRLTDSGTSALALAIRAAVTARPGAVALPAYGCFDLATAIDAADVPFVLYDVSPETLAPSRSALQEATAIGASVVVVTHLYGVPVDLAASRLCVSPETLFIDDAAQGVGASAAGRPLGAAGDFGVLSFGRGKGLTGGSGGALMINRADLAVTVPVSLPPSEGSSLRALLTAGALWLLGRPGLYAVPRALPFLGLGETRYRTPLPSTDISPFALGVLAAGVHAIDPELAVRRSTAQRYREALASVPGVHLTPDVEGAGWLRFPIVVADELRSSARSEGSARLGIMPGYPRSLAELEGFGRRRRNAYAEFPGARRLADGLFTLPTHGGLAARDIDAVIARVSRWS